MRHFICLLAVFKVIRCMFLHCALSFIQIKSTLECREKQRYSKAFCSPVLGCTLYIVKGPPKGLYLLAFCHENEYYHYESHF